MEESYVSYGESKLVSIMPLAGIESDDPDREVPYNRTSFYLKFVHVYRMYTRDTPYIHHIYTILYTGDPCCVDCESAGASVWCEYV